MILLLALGCGGPTVEPAPAPRVEPVSVELPADLEAQRAALRAQETDRLLEALANATEQGSAVAIAEILVAARAHDPAAFEEPWQRFTTDLLKQSPGVEIARAAAVLYDAARTPEERARWSAFATSTLARWRYIDEERARTAREHEGITRDMAHRAIDTLLEVHVDPPPSDRLLAPGIARLRDLSMLDGPVDVPIEGTEDLHAAIDLVVERAVASGTPEPTAVAELVEAVFSGVDQWTAPVWPAQVGAWQRHHDGVVQGVVGVVVDDAPEGVVVRRLVEDAPAWRADVHVGDRVVTVDGATVATAEAAASAMRGPDGSSVTLGLLREGVELSVPLVRATVPERTVAGWERSGPGWSVWIEPGIAYIRVLAFRPRTTDAFVDLLPARATMRGLVLDLRGNAGGDLESALAIADRFVADGPLLTVRTRVDLDRPEGWASASPGSPWEGLPIVVLVDPATASSAEILAGALQARGARVIGSRTTGKGTGQLLRTDDELGFAMQITHLRWALPDGRPLHRTDDATTWGIQPDVIDPLSPTEAFAVGVLRSRKEALPVHADGSPMPYAGPELDPALPPLDRDPHIVRALLHLRATTTAPGR
ncbi:MAG: PDZ domain-containing protein [Alphaproteobacteria bacterium]|nr:PDZ domain-containing protein [Alphaproteobacteria bacterium]